MPSVITLKWYLIEGLVPTREHPFANQVNAEIAKTLGAEIVFVATPGTNNACAVKRTNRCRLFKLRRH